MSYKVQLVLPDEVLDNLPKDRADWIKYLVGFFESGVLIPYEESLKKRQQGVMGGPLSKYEKTGYTDLLIDIALGQLRDRFEKKESSTEPLE